MEPDTEDVTMDGAVRVMIVDDHMMVRSGLRSILDSLDRIRVVGEAGDADSAQRVADDLDREGSAPHVVLMDLNMRGRDEGFSATERLISGWAEIAVIILTSFESDESFVRALHSGACGHLLKDASPAVLENAIMSAYFGQSAFPARALKVFAQLAVAHSPQAPELTGREIEIVQFLSRGLTNREIAGVLYLSEATVKTHVANVLTKLGVSTRQDAVARARDAGYIAPL